MIAVDVQVDQEMCFRDRPEAKLQKKKLKNRDITVVLLKNIVIFQIMVKIIFKNFKENYLYHTEKHKRLE